MEPLPVNKIPTHFGAHLDEVLAIFLLWNYSDRSEPLFPGVSNASVIFWNAGRKTPSGHYADEAWIRQHQMLPIGCAGSIFDEHPIPEQSLEEDAAQASECAATLVAKKLGIEQLPQLQSVLRFALQVDNNATADPRDISAVIKKLYDNRETVPGQVKKWAHEAIKAANAAKQPGLLTDIEAKVTRMLELLGRKISVEDQFEWVSQGIYAKMCEVPQTDDFRVETIGGLLKQLNQGEPYSPEEWLRIGTDALELDQLLFSTLTAWEYKKNKNIVPFRGLFRGKEVIDMKMAVVSSDDTRIHRYARSSQGDQVAITIQRFVNGRVIVMSNKYHGIRLRDAVRAIKTEEALLRGLEAPRWEEMKRSLLHFVWFYFVKGECLFNGAKTSPDTEPTKIPLARIVELVKTALAVEAFEPSRSETCLQGICSSTKRKPCQWYQYGFTRCQAIRWQEHRDTEAEVASVK